MSTFEPRRPFGPRDPNDGWAVGPQGRFWGRGGAAGLLACDPHKGVLLQHRVAWSDQGGTWGLPGGARHVDETAIDGAMREAGEEAGVPAEGHEVLSTYTFDVGYWSYTTVCVKVTEPFEAMITDPESVELRWVPPAEIEKLPLHPGFGGAWPELRRCLEQPPVLVVDAANVMGSRPDGWWNDRAGAAERLVAELNHIQNDGVPGIWFGLDDKWRIWPDVVVITEGQAKAAADPPAGRVSVVRADGDGDSVIVEQVAARRENQVVVVTADRALRDRVQKHGARTVGPTILLKQLVQMTDSADD